MATQGGSRSSSSSSATRPPNPQLSLGALIDTGTKRTKGRKFWQAKGPALAKYNDEIRPRLQSVLRNEGVLEHDVEIFLKVYMVASKNCAPSPMVMLSCINAKVREEARKAIKSSNVMAAWPDFSLASSAIAPELSTEPVRYAGMDAGDYELGINRDTTDRVLYDYTQFTSLHGSWNSMQDLPPPVMAYPGPSDPNWESLSNFSRSIAQEDEVEPRIIGSPSVRQIVLRSEPESGFIGQQILFTRQGAQRRIATGGPLIGWDGRLFQLTVGHVTTLDKQTGPSLLETEPNSQMDLDDLEFDDDDDDDENTEFSLVQNITSMGSKTPTECASSVGDESEDSTKDISDSSEAATEENAASDPSLEGSPRVANDNLRSTSFPSRPSGVLHYGWEAWLNFRLCITGNSSRSCSPMPSPSSKPTPVPSTSSATSCGYSTPITDMESSGWGFGPLLFHSSEGPHPALDYVLIEILPAERRTKVQEQLHISGVAPVGNGDTEILAATSSSGVLRGTLMPGVTSRWCKTYGEFQELYTVCFEKPLVEGDCGTAVVDKATGSLYGHVVLGSPGSNISYIVPAVDVLRDLTSRGGPTIAVLEKSEAILLPETPVPEEEAAPSLACRYCGKTHREAKSRDRHEMEVHEKPRAGVNRQGWYRCKCGRLFCYFRKANYTRHLGKCRNQKRSMATYHCQCGAEHADEKEHEMHYRNCNDGRRLVGRPPHSPHSGAAEKMQEELGGPI